MDLGKKLFVAYLFSGSQTMEDAYELTIKERQREAALLHAFWGTSVLKGFLDKWHSVSRIYTIFVARPLLNLRDVSVLLVSCFKTWSTFTSFESLNFYVAYLVEYVAKTRKRLKRTLFNRTRRNARIFDKVLFFEATYNTKIKINNQYVAFKCDNSKNWIQSGARKRTVWGFISVSD